MLQLPIGAILMEHKWVYQKNIMGAMDIYISDEVHEDRKWCLQLTILILFLIGKMTSINSFHYSHEKKFFLNFAIGHILRTKNTMDDKVVGGAQNMPCVIVYV
ncbi:hypothetical protein HID58_043740 [Brassica napus]|uniref:Uncharacterized protein n=1 Tax=Brassica napus TaxID=3708 RepID=A0ABQ8BIE5_BRANA|nr:hypothetical protein HID58_043740 [Brassica napus]